MRIIADWVELEAYIKTNPNPNYTIVFERFDNEGPEVSPHSAWIRPVVETEETEKDYFKHHMYLSTHTFYGKNKDGSGVDSYKESTRILQKFGFNIELENWDK